VNTIARQPERESITEPGPPSGGFVIECNLGAEMLVEKILVVVLAEFALLQPQVWILNLF
jgi:hypothetical protein